MKFFLSKLIAIFFANALVNFAYCGTGNAQFILEDAPVIAFTESRLIDGTGAAVKEKQTIVIRDGRITEIGPDGTVKIPKEAKCIPLKGKSLLPGWVMVQAPIYSSARSAEFEKVSPYRPSRSYIFTQQPISYPRLYLAAGVTSARTLGSIDPYTDLNIKKQISAGVLLGPDFDLTAPHLDGEPGELQMNSIKSASEARKFVRYWAAQGFSSFHTYEDITYDQMVAATEEAHKLGLPVAFHSAEDVSLRDAVELGVSQLTHGMLEVLWDLALDEVGGTAGTSIEKKRAQLSNVQLLSPSDPRVKEKVQSTFRFLIDHNVAVTSVNSASIRTPFPEDIVALYNKYGLADYQSFQPYAESIDVKSLDGNTARLLELEVAFWKAGGLLTVGTDAGQGLIAGYTNLRAIELLVESGIPPLAAIKIATQNGAKAMGISSDRGTVEVGKRADLIVASGDPSVTIADIYNIEIVFKGGTGYNPVALKESAKGTISGPSN